MSKPIEVGCVVELIACTLPENRAWVGRQMIVVGFCTIELPNGRGVLTQPRPERNEMGWNPAHLRRIDPPDWEASRTTDKALEV